MSGNINMTNFISEIACTFNDLEKIFDYGLQYCHKISNRINEILEYTKSAKINSNESPKTSDISYKNKNDSNEKNIYINPNSDNTGNIKTNIQNEHIKTRLLQRKRFSKKIKSKKEDTFKQNLKMKLRIYKGGLGYSIKVAIDNFNGLIGPFSNLNYTKTIYQTIRLNSENILLTMKTHQLDSDTFFNKMNKFLISNHP